MAAIFQIKRGSTQASLTDGELYLHYDKGTLQISSGSDTPLDLLPLDKQVVGNVILQGNITASNAFFTGDVAISGNLFLGNNQSDNINALGVFTSNLTPGTTNTYSIGTTTAVWSGVYGNIISGSQISGSFFGNTIGTGSYSILAATASSADNFIIRGYTDYNTAITAPAHQEGRLHWSTDTSTLQIDTDVNNFMIEVGHTNVVKVVNRLSYTVTKGTIVYISGSQGNRPGIATASYETDATSANTVGFVAADIASNNNGYVVTQGLLRNQDTSLYTPGTQLYLSSSGKFSSVAPTQPLHAVRLGKVVVQSNGNGVIFVQVQNGYELDEIHDVLITSPANQNILTYNSTIGVWENKTTGFLGLATTASLNTFSGSQITQNAALATVTGSLITSASNDTAKFLSLLTVTSSLITSASNDTTKFVAVATVTGSLITSASNDTTKFVAVATVTGSLISSASNTETKAATLATYSGSINTKFTDLATLSGSLITSASNDTAKFLSVATVTGSLITSASNDNNKFTTLATYTGSTNNRLNEIENKSGSFDTSVSKLNSFTQSLNQAISASGTDLIVIGNLTVQGTQTTLNTNELVVEDKFITIASGSTNAAAANGAGIYIDGAAISMSWDNANTRLYFNTNIAALGTISGSTIVGLNGSSVSDYSASVQGKVASLIANTSSYETRGNNIVSSSTDTNSIKFSISTGNVSAYAAGGVVSGSSQINYTQLSSINPNIVSASGNTNSIVTIITGGSISSYAAGGVVSGSSQINYNQLSNLSANIISASTDSSTIDFTISGGSITAVAIGGIVSQSSQIDATQTTNWSTGIKTQLNSNTVISGSSQILGGTGIHSGSYFAEITVVSGSSQVLGGSGVFSSSIQLPQGLVSGSSQVLGGTGIVSGAAQIPSILPQGVVSGSGQVLGGTGILSSSNTTFATYTGSTDNRLNNLEITSGSGTNSILKLNTFTSSLDARFTSIESATSSLFASASSLTQSFTALKSQFEVLNSSLDPDGFSEFRVGTELYTQSADFKFAAIAGATSSLQNFSSSALSRLTNLEITASYTSQSAYTFASLTGSFFGLLNDLASKTGSYATSGSNTFVSNQTISGSVSVSGSFTASLQDGYAWVGRGDGIARAVATSSFSTLLPSGILSSSTQDFNSYSSSVAMDHMGVSMSLDTLTNRLVGVVSSSTDTSTITIGIKDGIISASVIGNIVSSSAQVVNFLPQDTVSGSSQIIFNQISSLPALVSGAIQIYAPSTDQWPFAFRTELNTNSVISSSTQLPILTGGSNIVSGSGQLSTLTNGSGIFSQSSQLVNDFVTVASTQNITGTKTFGTVNIGTLNVTGQATYTYTAANNVQIGDNILTLNYGGPALQFGGIQVTDTYIGGTNISGSLIYDGNANIWRAGAVDGESSFSTLPKILTDGLNAVSSSTNTNSIVTTIAGGSISSYAAGGVVSGSGQLPTLTGGSNIVSGAAQISTVTGGSQIHSGSYFAGISVISSSTQLPILTGGSNVVSQSTSTNSIVTTITNGNITSYAAGGVVSGSGQLPTLTGGSNIVSGSAQISTVTGGSTIFSGSFTKGGGLVDYSNGVSLTQAIAIWRAPYTCTVTAVRGRVVGGNGTQYFNACKNVAGTRTSFLTGTTSVQAVANDTWYTGTLTGTTANLAIASGDTVEIIITGSTASHYASQSLVQIEFTR